jgi:hypothetical protein
LKQGIIRSGLDEEGRVWEQYQGWQCERRWRGRMHGSTGVEFQQQQQQRQQGGGGGGGTAAAAGGNRGKRSMRKRKGRMKSREKKQEQGQ